MLWCDSVITPTRRAVPFGDDDFLVEEVYEDHELRPLVPHVDEMLGDITATWRSRDELGDEFPEWDDPEYSESRKYAEQVRATLIDAGCIFAEFDRDDKAICFTGRGQALKASFDLCLELADNLEVEFRVASRSTHDAARVDS